MSSWKIGVTRRGGMYIVYFDEGDEVRRISLDQPTRGLATESA